MIRFTHSDGEVDDVVRWRGGGGGGGGGGSGRNVVRAVVAEVDGAGGEEHEGAVVGLLGVGFLVVGGGEVDAGAALKGGEEGGCHVGPKPTGDAVDLLVRQARALALALHCRNKFFVFWQCAVRERETVETDSSNIPRKSNADSSALFLLLFVGP